MKPLSYLLPRVALAVAGLAALGGCVYDPAYYHRNGVVYDDGPASTYYDDGYYTDGYYAPGYYYGPSYYPSYYPYGYYGYGWPIGVGLGFSYYGGGHHWSGGHHSGHWSGNHSGGTHHHH